MKYELVSGLETHVELSTNTKIFCSCTTDFGGEQNTHCCPICIGLPGTLPKLNQKVVDYAIMAGLATNCEISHISKMDRKNYCYPDLPKAYQISQFDMPLCKNGYIELSNGRKIGITRIHIEEDAGKLVHQRGNTYVDYNRGGVPLIEIVSEPDIRSIDEAREYVEKLQMIMRYIDVSDCKMQEGSLRCDVNISLRPIGSTEFGTRTEIKNMNSFTYMTKAMEYEVSRQAELLDEGKEVTQETLRYIVEENRTEKIDHFKSLLPELPDAKFARYVNELGIPEVDAGLLVKFRKVAEYFEKASEGVANPKVVANCIIGQIFRRVENETEKEAFDIALSPEYLRDLVLLLDSGKIKMNLLKSTLEKMLDEGKPATDFIKEEDMGGVDADTLKKLCTDAIASNPNAVADYLGGKEKALKSLLGFVMKNSRGRADAVEAEKLLIEMVNASK